MNATETDDSVTWAATDDEGTWLVTDYDPNIQVYSLGDRALVITEL